MRRLTENTVDLGFKTVCRLATSPTMFCMGSTTDGITFLPSAEWITLGDPPSMTATHEFVVPRSIPIIFAILTSYKIYKSYNDYNTYASFCLPTFTLATLITFP